MKNMEMWHVIKDPETGRRSCHYFIGGSLRIQEDGKIGEVMEGKEEVPFEDWTDKEMCEILTRHIEGAGMQRLKTIPNIVLRSMEKYGVDERTRTEVMKKIVESIP